MQSGRHVSGEVSRPLMGRGGHVALGARGRTCNLFLTGEVLYQLSYPSVGTARFGDCGLVNQSGPSAVRRRPSFLYRFAATECRTIFAVLRWYRLNRQRYEQDRNPVVSPATLTLKRTIVCAAAVSTPLRGVFVRQPPRRSPRPAWQPISSPVSCPSLLCDHPRRSS